MEGPVLARHRLRVYADTSVFGGCFDEEFAADSSRFFDEVRSGRFALVTSGVLLRELGAAPERVRRVLADVPREHVEGLPDTDEIRELRDAYLAAGVVGPGSEADAEHVAAATVAGVDVILSWNFKHVVHFEKIRGYQGVNLLRGYGPVSIHTPKEVVGE